PPSRMLLDLLEWRDRHLPTVLPARFDPLLAQMLRVHDRAAVEMVAPTAACTQGALVHIRVTRLLRNLPRQRRAALLAEPSLQPHLRPIHLTLGSTPEHARNLFLKLNWPWGFPSLLSEEWDDTVLLAAASRMGAPMEAQLRTGMMEPTHHTPTRARLLRVLANPSLVEPLLMTLASTQVSVRREAARGLGHVGPDVVLEPLLLRWHDHPSAFPRQTSRRAFRRGALRVLVQWPEHRPTRAALAGLWADSPPKAIRAQLGQLLHAPTTPNPWFTAEEALLRARWAASLAPWPVSHHPGTQVPSPTPWPALPHHHHAETGLHTYPPFVPSSPIPSSPIPSSCAPENSSARLASLHPSPSSTRVAPPQRVDIGCAAWGAQPSYLQLSHMIQACAGQDPITPIARCAALESVLRLRSPKMRQLLLMECALLDDVALQGTALRGGEVPQASWQALMTHRLLHGAGACDRELYTAIQRSASAGLHIQMLHHRLQHIRDRAAANLVATPELLTHVEPLLSSERAEVRAAAALCLQRAGLPEAVRPLRQALLRERSARARFALGTAFQALAPSRYLGDPSHRFGIYTDAQHDTINDLLAQLRFVAHNPVGTASWVRAVDIMERLRGLDALEIGIEYLRSSSLAHASTSVRPTHWDNDPRLDALGTPSIDPWIPISAFLDPGQRAAFIQTEVHRLDNVSPWHLSPMGQRAAYQLQTYAHPLLIAWTFRGWAWCAQHLLTPDHLVVNLRVPLQRQTASQLAVPSCTLGLWMGFGVRLLPSIAAPALGTPDSIDHTVRVRVGLRHPTRHDPELRGWMTRGYFELKAWEETTTVRTTQTTRTRPSRPNVRP
ncbi:MAG: hypothetical protein AAFX99_15065, partial [Myxococcota bacterium]